MIVTYWKGVFVADSKEEDRKTLERAGFELHEPTLCVDEQEKPCKGCKAKIGRRYFTNRIETATRLKAFCNERALKVMENHLAMIDRSRAVDSSLRIPCPEGLAYLPYQKAGIAYASQRKDTLIGDQPGLGKTIQALGFINLIRPKNVIVVCPNTLVANWKEEADKWLIDDYELILPKTKQSAVPSREGLLVITNYEKLVGDSALSRSIKRTWDLFVGDEIHMVKNPQAERSRAIYGEHGIMRYSKRCLFLTGTPAENFPKEIWPIAAAIAPTKFGDWWEFARRYCGLHQEERMGRKIWVAEGATNLPELQQKLRATFMVRRLKQDVLPELPPKRRQLIMLDDGKASWLNDPRFVRWKTVYEQDYDARSARLEFAKTDAEYREAALSLEKFTGIPFQEMSEFRHESALAKLPLCIKYIDDMLKSGVESLVIFAHHTDVIDKLKAHFGDDAVVVDGRTPMNKRQLDDDSAVKLFQSKRKRILIGQLRVAGVGLTLHTANTVVFVEIDWVPGLLTQAEDRLCRIGQKKMVHVIHLLLKGTLDANMCQKIVKKQEILDKMLDRSTDLKVAARR